jgi:hypothetical protein
MPKIKKVKVEEESEGILDELAPEVSVELNSELEELQRLHSKLTELKIDRISQLEVMIANLQK